MNTSYICEKFIPFPLNSVGLITTEYDIENTFSILIEADEYIDEQLKRTGKLREVLIVGIEDTIRELKAKINELNLKHLNHIHISSTYSFNTEENFSIFKNDSEKYGLIIINPMLSFYLENKDDNTNAKKFMIPFVKLATEQNQNIIFFHHAAKEKRGLGIAGAFTDATRLAYYVTKESQLDKSVKLRFEIQKENDDIKSIKKLDNITTIGGIGSFLIREN